MKKLLFLAGVLILSGNGSFAYEPGSHPWLDSEMKKHRYKCPAGKSPFMGPQDAQVTIVEFVDYDCPFCAEQEKARKKIVAAYPTQVKWVIKNLPLDIHPNAKKKAIVAHCMALQGKFWQAHERLLAQEPKNKVRAGVDEKKLEADIAQGGDGQVDRDMACAKGIGMATTPAFVVDGIRQGGALNFKQLKMLVDAELERKAAKAEKAQQMQQASQAQQAEQNDQPRQAQQ